MLFPENVDTGSIKSDHLGHFFCHLGFGVEKIVQMC